MSKCIDTLQKINTHIMESPKLFGNYAIVKMGFIMECVDSIYSNVVEEIAEANSKNCDLSNCHIFDNIKALEMYLDKSSFCFLGIINIISIREVAVYIKRISDDLNLINGIVR